MTGPSADVLVLSPTFHPEKVGTPHYATDMVREMSRQGHRPQVVTNQPYYPAFERFEGYVRRTRRDELDGIPLRRLPTIVPPNGSRAGRIVADLNLLLQVLVRRW